MSENTKFQSFLLNSIFFIGRYVTSIPSLILNYPVRVIFEFFTITHPNIFKCGGCSKARHESKVKAVQKQVDSWNKKGRKGKLCTGRSRWKTMSVNNYSKDNMTQIFMDDLDEIIEIDTERNILKVEPGLKIGTLTHKLVPMGWTIPVVPELETLMIGGLICGAGLETSSHKYGLFGETCLEYEILLADGRVVNCSKDENSEIFYSVPMSHGTVGFLLSVTFPLIPAAKYVMVEYTHATSIPEITRLLQAQNYEFIEGILLDKDNAIIMHGNFTDTAEEGKINSVLKWYKPWFYKHVQSFLDLPGHHVEYIPTRQYYHRHQKCIFWELSYLIPFGNHTLFRYLLGWTLPINFQILKILTPNWLFNLEYKLDHFTQDFILPLSAIGNTIDLCHKELSIYPIWLCPIKMMESQSMIHKPTDWMEDMAVDIGIYGSPKVPQFHGQTAVRKFEKFTLDNKGIQAVYADNYLTKADFEQMFDTRLYDKVRKDLDLEAAFPHSYDKISRAARRI